MIKNIINLTAEALFTGLQKRKIMNKRLGFIQDLSGAGGGERAERVTVEGFGVSPHVFF